MYLLFTLIFFAYLLFFVFSNFINKVGYLTYVISAYVLFNFFLGSVAFEFNLLGGNIAFKQFAKQYILLEYIQASSLLLLANLLFFNLGAYRKNISVVLSDISILSSNYYSFVVLYFPFGLIYFFFNEFRPDLLGAFGNFSNFYYFFFCFFFVIASSDRKYRMIISIFLLSILLSYYSFGDRRDVLYFIVISGILFIYKHKPKKIALLLVGSLFLLLGYLSIMLMSGLRGSYSIVTLEDFISQIDVVYFYFHGINSVNAVLLDLDLIQFGSTVIKPLFVLFPREIFVDLKPHSMLTLYGNYYDIDYRSEGNSYPVNFFSELVWNFHIFSVVFAYLFGRLIRKFEIFTFNLLTKNKIYSFTIFLSSWFLIFNVVRGAGLEYFVYGFVFLCTAALIARYTSIQYFIRLIKANG